VSEKLFSSTYYPGLETVYIFYFIRFSSDELCASSPYIYNKIIIVIVTELVNSNETNILFI
jgi:hypothetical protein